MLVYIHVSLVNHCSNVHEGVSLSSVPMAWCSTLVLNLIFTTHCLYTSVVKYVHISGQNYTHLSRTNIHVSIHLYINHSELMLLFLLLLLFCYCCCL